MLITNSIKMDLKNRGVPPVVYAVQNEVFSRAIELVLKDGGKPWNVPTGTTAAIRFKKSDGKGGVYDTLPGGSVAYNIDSNKVTFYLAPQVLTSDGIATVQLVLMKQKDVLCSFGIHINVESDVSIGEPASEDYVNLKNVMLEQIENYFATHPDAGLSMLLLPNISGEGVASHDVYISDFQIPPGFVPKSGDLVLHSDGYLGYIQSVDHEVSNTVNVVMFSPPVSLKGDQSVMVVHIDDANDEITADKTHAEILSAIQNGRLVMGVYKGEKSVCSGPFDATQYLRFDPVYVNNARMPHRYFSVSKSNVWTMGKATVPTDEHINELIDAKDEVFVAEYGITRFREIFDAYYADRACYIQYGEIGPRRFTCVYCMPEMCVFSGVQEDETFVITVRPGEDSDEWDYARYPIYTDEDIEEMIDAAVPVGEKLMLVRFNTQPDTPNCNKTYSEILQAIKKQRPVFAFRGNDSTGEMYIAVQVPGAIDFYPFYTGNGDGDRSVYSFVQITKDNEVIMGELIRFDTKSEVFIAEYNSTTVDDIIGAHNAGKVCVARFGNYFYPLVCAVHYNSKYSRQESVFTGMNEACDSLAVIRVPEPIAPATWAPWEMETYPLYTDEHINKLIDTKLEAFTNVAEEGA